MLEKAQAATTPFPVHPRAHSESRDSEFDTVDASDGGLSETASEWGSEASAGRGPESGGAHGRGFDAAGSSSGRHRATSPRAFALARVERHPSALTPPGDAVTAAGGPSSVGGSAGASPRDPSPSTAVAARRAVVAARRKRRELEAVLMNGGEAEREVAAAALPEVQASLTRLFAELHAVSRSASILELHEPASLQGMRLEEEAPRAEGENGNGSVAASL